MKWTRNKKMGLMIFLIGLILVTVGVSYAYFTATSQSKQQVVESGTLSILYETGQDIKGESISPSEEEKAKIHQFTINNNGTLDAHYTISFVDISLTKNGMASFSSNLRWALYTADSNYIEQFLVKTGSFSSEYGYLSGDDTFVLKNNLILGAGNKEHYILKIWLQETGYPQNEDQNINLSMKVQVETLEKQEPVSKLSMLRERNNDTSTELFYAYRDSITKIVFQNRLNPPAEKVEEWDVSTNNDGNCMAYLVSTTQTDTPTYTLYIQGNDEIYLESGLYLFYQFANLESIEGLEYVNTSKANSLKAMFNECSSLTNLDLSHFDTTNILDLSYMFRNCTNLTEVNLSNFITSKVTTMAVMFKDCTNLQNLDVSKFDTSNVTNMTYMFMGCSSLDELNVSNFNTSKVTDMRSLFYGCSNLTSLDVSHFDTSKVTDLGYLFYGCSKLTTIDVSHFNTTSAKIMFSMFSGCSSLTSIDVSNFVTNQVTGLEYMFANCSSLTELNLENFNTEKVTNMNSMFYNCQKLSSLHISNFDTTNVTDMGSMFYNCFGFTTLNLSFLDTSSVKNMKSMFYNCNQLTNLSLNSFVTTSVENMNGMFANCNRLESLNLSNFDTTKVTDMGSIFLNCKNLQNLNLQNFSFDAVTITTTMFNNVPTTIQIIVKDTKAQSFVQDKLGAGKGTVVIAS